MADHSPAPFIHSRLRNYATRLDASIGGERSALMNSQHSSSKMTPCLPSDAKSAVASSMAVAAIASTSSLLPPLNPAAGGSPQAAGRVSPPRRMQPHALAAGMQLALIAPAEQAAAEAKQQAAIAEEISALRAEITGG